MPVMAGKPTWSSGSFLVYTGGLTVLGAAVAALRYLSSQYGEAAYAGWALLVLAVLYAIADGLRRREHWLSAGIFAFASVVAWGAFVGALFNWWGWLDLNSSFAHFSLARLVADLLLLAAAFALRHRFRFPLITVMIAFTGWFFVVDLVSSGGDWTAVVSLLVGLFYLAIAGSSARPAAFWLSLAAGVLVGGSLLFWWHNGDTEWALICVASLAYVGVARATGRSSWAVLGALGLLAASAKFAIEWTHPGTSILDGTIVSSPKLWVPSVVFAFTGFLLVALGIAARRRSE